MDPTIILRQVGADPLELAAGEGNILARVESNISLEQYSINVVQKTIIQCSHNTMYVFPRSSIVEDNS